VQDHSEARSGFIVGVESTIWFRDRSPGVEFSNYTILVVDDEELIRNLVVTVLSRVGHSGVTAMNGVDALHKMKENNFDAVITDIKMPEMDGIILTREISKQNPRLPVMVMTAFDEEYSAGTAISCGAREFIIKPFSPNEFIIRLHKMIKESETIKQTKKEKDGDGNIEDFVNELETLAKRKNGP
jgi:DNA-binding NtrC family response regulator